MDGRQVDKLLVKISRGDNAAFSALYDCTRRGVYSFLYSYLKNKEDTEDAMQNVFLKIKLNIDKYAQGTNGRAWILQIAKNTALNELAKKRRQTYETPVADEVNSTGVMEIMEKALAEDERQIVILHVLWGYKHREIAEKLCCPTGTVTSKYKRSIEKIKTALKEADL